MKTNPVVMNFPFVYTGWRFGWFNEFNVPFHIWVIFSIQKLLMICGLGFRVWMV
jgi:hypothetical protein